MNLLVNVERYQFVDRSSRSHALEQERAGTEVFVAQQDVLACVRTFFRGLTRLRTRMSLSLRMVSTFARPTIETDEIHTTPLQ